jgi:hypothetical protein
MRNPVRITIAMDKNSYEIFEKLKETTNDSQSEIMRNALSFYYLYRDLQKYGIGRIKTYAEMLAEGEHVILDIDHWISFLRFIETHPEKDKFWEIHREIARAHAEEFSDMRVEEILERLEACNLFRINKRSGEWTLVLNDEMTKRFIKTFLEEIFSALNFKIEIKEDLMKIRLRGSFK